MMLAWLSGKKTYFISAGLVILSGLHAQGYLDDALYASLQGVLLGGGLASLRAGVTKSS
jgi:hypothetical protein